MGPSEARAVKAVNAMKDMGISEKRVKPILRNLLRLYDKNWELIEDENYRVLIDAIFEQENVGEDENKNSDLHVPEESSQPPLKRVRTRAQAEQVSSSSEVPLVKPKVEGGGSPINRRLRSREHGSTASQVHDKGKEGPSLSHSLSDCEEISPPHVRDRAVPARSFLGVCLKEPKVEPGITIQPKQSMRDAREHSGLLRPKNEPMEVDPPFETPIAIISPSETERAIREVALQEDVCSTVNSFPGQINGSAEHLNDAELLVSKGKQDGISGAVCKTVTSSELANDGETPKSFEIASSPSGEVKISLNCNHPERSDFRVPSLDAVLKAVEDKCLRSYRILEPNFSMVNLMQEMCQSFLELSNKSPDPKEDTMIHLETDFNFLKNYNLQNAFGLNGGQQVNIQMPESSSVEVLNLPSASETPKVLLLADGDTIGEKDTEESDPIASSSRSLVVVPQYVAVDCVTPLHDVNDISKGEEKVRISLINELTSEPFPPKFYYIPQNIVYQNAYMNFSLARIGDEDCCSGCFGDCLSSSITCACARETGGEFAYTLEGLVKEKFLEECISLNRDPQQERHYHCKECPLERSKDGVSDSCKGHLVRKFIKECWSKCGCNMQCGNRVVQRGIRCNLQVFFTSEGKGWGLRTLEDLPKGSFVCEYVGEVLTNTELHERNMRSTGNEKHTYPVLLDADWGSEGVLKDEEALCLDATYFGNVARFINHRCYDGNMVEIPVEVETPDHHYYHLAFFTTRNVDALEELTWDYGIDFSDHTHPVKAFRCLCGSKCCRDMKRSHRTKSRR